MVTHNYCVRDYLTSKHYWKTTFRAPCLSGVLPPQHKQPHCGHTKQLCGLFDLKTLLKNNFQSPMFTRGSPSTTQTITVWAHTTTVLVNSPQITTGKQLSEPHVYQGPSPTTQTTTLWAHTTTVWVNWPQNTTAKQLSGHRIYQGFSLHNTNNHCVGTHNHCAG